MKPLAVETIVSGQRLDPAAAKKRVDELDQLAQKIVHEHLLTHPFMIDLAAGKLPMEKVQQYFRYWYTFALEVNTSCGMLYHRFVDFFKQHPDFEDIITEKLADEYGQPGRGGHIRTFEKTAESLGISKKELVYQEISPAARAFVDFHVRLTTEGTLAEFYAMSIGEGQWGDYSEVFSKALLTHYLKNSTKADEPYFSIHAEADREEHVGGMAHGDMAKNMMCRLYEIGEAKFRPGFSPEYAIFMTFDLGRRLLDDVYKGITVEGELAKLSK